MAKSIRVNVSDTLGTVNDFGFKMAVDFGNFVNRVMSKFLVEIVEHYDVFGVEFLFSFLLWFLLFCFPLLSSLRVVGLLFAFPYVFVRIKFE